MLPFHSSRVSVPSAEDSLPLAPYERNILRVVTGDALRPGGLAVTREGVDLCGFCSGDILLDVGCGLGASLGFLRERGFAALGMDISPRLLAQAHAAHSEITLLRADMHRLPLREQSVDGIVCECVLSLAADKRAVLREFFRVLRFGGRLVLSDLAYSSPLAAKDRETKQAPEAAPASCLHGATSYENLRGLLSEAGFTPVHERDCTRALRETAARMVLHFGSTASFRQLWYGGEHSADQALPCSTWSDPGRKLGYVLFTAQKNSGSGL